MITLRKSSERGKTRAPWLTSNHTFAFGNYHDPEHSGYSWLRVINDDIVAPGEGFPVHAHRDMEIITYVLKGALEHRDSLGNGSVIAPGEVQRMSAGTGIEHSEFNASKSKPVHFLQIWVIPEKRGFTPSYDQRAFPIEERKGVFRLLVSPDGRVGSIPIHQDVDMYATTLSGQDAIEFPLLPGRKAWIHIASGAALLNGIELFEGDGAAVAEEEVLEFSSIPGAEILLFDLP